MKTVIISVVAVLVSVLLLGIKVLFIKGAKFPSGHISESEALRHKGIRCAHSSGTGESTNQTTHIQ